MGLIVGFPEALESGFGKKRSEGCIEYQLRLSEGRLGLDHRLRRASTRRHHPYQLQTVQIWRFQRATKALPPTPQP